MYIQGVSTRKVTKIVEELCSHSVSSTQVSNCAAALDAELQIWRERPLGACTYRISVWLSLRLLSLLPVTFPIVSFFISDLFMLMPGTLAERLLPFRPGGGRFTGPKPSLFSLSG